MDKVCIFDARIAKQTKVELNINCVTPKLLYLNNRYLCSIFKYKAMFFLDFLKRRRLKFDAVSLLEVTFNTALFFFNFRSHLEPGSKLHSAVNTAYNAVYDVVELLKEENHD